MEDGMISPKNKNNKTGTGSSSSSSSSNHFLYKAILLSIFLLFIPISSTDFMNKTTTASWGELLQLAVVGIAVCYGVFSTKRNIPSHDETYKQETLADVQSYVARMFHVSPSSSSSSSSSSVFDEIKTTFPSEDNSITKVFNSRYYRGEPIVVVANKDSSSSVVDDISVLRSPVPWRSRSSRNLELAAAAPTPPPPPPPPPPPVNRNNKNKFSRNYDWQNSRGTRRGTSLSSFKEPNQTQIKQQQQQQQHQHQQNEEENYLSHDHEIENFIETRGGKKFIKDEHKSIPNPKQQQKQDENEKEITDTEESNSDEDDDELRELASKTSNENGGQIAGPDVDKKADEFIAKFREQIRLQRIASSRTSTQIQKNNIN